MSREGFLKPTGFGELIYKTVNLYSGATGRPIIVKFDEPANEWYLPSGANIRSIFTDFKTVTVDSDLLDKDKTLDKKRIGISDRMDHILSHILYGTDIVVMSRLVGVVVNKLMRSKTLKISMTEIQVRQALFKLMMSLEDSRVLYQWGLRYPGSADRNREAKLSVVIEKSFSALLVDPYETFDLDFVTGSMLGTTRRFRKMLSSLIIGGSIETELKRILASDIDHIHNDIEFPVELSTSKADEADSAMMEAAAFSDKVDEQAEESYKASVEEAMDIIGRSEMGDNFDLTGYTERVVSREVSTIIYDPDPVIVNIFKQWKSRRIRTHDDFGMSIDPIRYIDRVTGGRETMIFRSDSSNNGFELSILIDKSRSMTGLPFSTALSAASEVYESAKRADVDVSVMSFTCITKGELLIEEYNGTPVQGEDTRFGSTPLHAAVDYIFRKVSKSHYKKRAVLILSDGSPNFVNAEGNNIVDSVVVEAMRGTLLKMKESGIKVHAAIIPADKTIETQLKNFEGVCTTTVLKNESLKEEIRSLAISMITLQ